MTREALWDRLRTGGLVEGDPPPAEEASAPWFVRLMLGVAGWIGALFLLGFAALGFSSIIDDAAGALTLGLFCCAGAYILFRFTGGSDLAGQFGLAVSLAGQALIVFGLAMSVSDESATLFLMVALLQAALVLLMPNVVHRVLSAFGGAVALALGMNRLGLYGIGPALLCAGLVLIWLEPTRWARSGKLLRPAGYGLALAVLAIEGVRLFFWDWLYDLKSTTPTWLMLHGPELGRAIVALLLLWTAHRLLAREAVPRASPTWLAAMGGALILALLSLLAPGIGPALLVLLLGFGAGNRILVGLGILSLVGFVSHYYYSLHATLLAKSAILAATGLCLLGAHFLFRRLFAASPLPETADA